MVRVVGDIRPARASHVERYHERRWQDGHGHDRGLEEPVQNPPPVDVQPEDNLMVIYTSGTTGLPKGINNNHVKFFLIGLVVSGNVGLGPDDVAYLSMPLFHSNSVFLGLMPAVAACGSVGIRERFSASAFARDVFGYGATFWNYVGEPVHYVLSAIEKEYGH